MKTYTTVLRWCGIIILVAIVLGGLAFLTWSPRPSVSQVKVSGCNQAQKNVIKHQLSQINNVNWFRINLTRIQQVLERASGIDQAVVSRGQPFQLQVDVRPQHLVALWNKHKALNQRGQVIRLPKWCQHRCKRHLPHLKGPKGQQRRLLSLYQLLQSQAKSVKLSVRVIEMDRKGVITVTLANGLQITMGEEQDLTRWQHFVTVYPQIFSNRHKQGTKVDLRYTNGMAVQWGKQHG